VTALLEDDLGVVNVDCHVIHNLPMRFSSGRAVSSAVTLSLCPGDSDRNRQAQLRVVLG